MTEPRMMDVSGSLRKIAGELIEIGDEVHEQPDVVDKIGAASFMIVWIADGLDRALIEAQQRTSRQMQQLNSFIYKDQESFDNT